MTGLQYALERVHHAERELAEHLVEIAGRHSVEHEVFHVALDCARWSRENLAALAAVAADHGVELSAQAPEPGLRAHLGDVLSRLTGRQPAAGLLLLEDLRAVYLMASSASLAWELLAQHAQATRERDLLELAGRCHPQTLRQIRWANTMLKTLSPQVLAGV